MSLSTTDSSELRVQMHYGNWPKMEKEFSWDLVVNIHYLPISVELLLFDNWWICVCEW